MTDGRKKESKQGMNKEERWEDKKMVGCDKERKRANGKIELARQQLRKTASALSRRCRRVTTEVRTVVFAKSPLENSLAMKFPQMEITFERGAIRKLSNTMAFHFTIPKITFIRWAIRHSKNSLAMLLIIHPITSVTEGRWPNIGTFAVSD